MQQMTSVPPELVELFRQEAKKDSFFALPEVAAWANDDCLRRYLRARDQNLEKAALMLQATVHWRVENAIHTWLPARSSTMWPVIESESATGKMFVLPEVNTDGCVLERGNVCVYIEC